MEPLGQGRGNATKHIENRETDMPHGVLDIVPEDPEIEHVADEVHPAAVKEHGGDHREFRRHGAGLGDHYPAAEKRRRNEAEGEDGAFRFRREKGLLPQEYEAAGDDQADRYDRLERRRIVVVKRYHERLGLPCPR